MQRNENCFIFFFICFGYCVFLHQHWSAHRKCKTNSSVYCCIFHIFPSFHLHLIMIMCMSFCYASLPSQHYFYWYISCEIRWHTFSIRLHHFQFLLTQPYSQNDTCCDPVRCGQKKMPLLTFCRWQRVENVKYIAMKHSELSAIAYVIFFLLNKKHVKRERVRWAWYGWSSGFFATTCFSRFLPSLFTGLWKRFVLPAWLKRM